jgi:hypothetical protein
VRVGVVSSTRAPCNLRLISILLTRLLSRTYAHHVRRESPTDVLFFGVSAARIDSGAHVEYLNRPQQ